MGKKLKKYDRYQSAADHHNCSIFLQCISELSCSRKRLFKATDVFQYPERQRSSDHTFLRYELSHDHWWNRYLRRWRGSTGQYELCGIPGLWRRQCIHFYADRRCYRPCLRYRTGLPGSVPGYPALYRDTGRDVLCQRHDHHRKILSPFNVANENFTALKETRVFVPGMGSVNKLGNYVNAYVEIGVIVALMVVIVMFVMLRWTKMGRSFYAVGGNNQSALMLGINVKRTKFLSHLLCGLLAGIGGYVYFLHVGKRFGFSCDRHGDECHCILYHWRYNVDRRCW